LFLIIYPLGIGGQVERER